MTALLTQADGLAISMIVMLVLSFGVVLTILVSIARSAARRDREVERLLDEVERERRPPAPAATGEGDEERREPWERESDWWKSRDP